MAENCLPPFCYLLNKLNGESVPPVSCIVLDANMTFTVEAAKEFGIPQVLFWTASAVGLMCYLHFPNLF